MVATTGLRGTLDTGAKHSTTGSRPATAVINPFGYGGQYTDAESGLQYLRARYYDPDSAQFVSRDPLVGLTRSAYGYVSSNPLNGTDPTGRGMWDTLFELLSHVAGPIGGCPIQTDVEEHGSPADCVHPQTSNAPPPFDSHKGTAVCNSVDDCWYTFPGGPAPRTIYVPGQKYLVKGPFGIDHNVSGNPLYGPSGWRSTISGASGEYRFFDPARVPGNQNFVWTPCEGGLDQQTGPGQ